MSDNSSNRTDVSTIHLDNISLQNRENVDSDSKFLGLDLSTQQVGGWVDLLERASFRNVTDFDNLTSQTLIS